MSRPHARRSTQTLQTQRGLVGAATRGTTGYNRLRRVDRWICAQPTRVLPATALAVDLGFGAHGGTTLELWARLRRVRPAAEVVGIEIDPERVLQAQPLQRSGLSFVHGGFELPLPAHRPIHVIRAYNVLRQYGVEQVHQVWDMLASRLAPDGVLIDGTCDELGRRHAFVQVGADSRALALTLVWKFGAFERPSDIAERLPKVLIHENVPGTPIHAFLAQLDLAWQQQVSRSVFGPSDRFMAMAHALYAAGVLPRYEPRRWRLGEITVPWEMVAP